VLWDLHQEVKTGKGRFSNIMSLRIFSILSGGRRPGRRIAGVSGCLLFAMVSMVWSQALNPVPLTDRVLTNIAEIWSMPYEHRDKEYRIRTEMLIYYFDAEWGNASGECLGTPRWLPIFDSPVPLKAGQRVAIDGVIVPQRERLVWDKTRIRILEENVELKAEAVPDLSKNPQELRDRLVSVTGLIDSALDDPTHFAFNFLSGNTLARAYVMKGSNRVPPPLREGDLIRMKCVYSPQFDRNGNLTDLSLLVNSPADVEAVGSLKTDARFAIPITFSKDIQSDTPVGDLIRVAGLVRKYEPGQWVTLWDATGQVMVQSKQSQPLRFGDRVEAVGYPYIVGVQQCLHGGLYRLAAATNLAATLITTNSLPLRLAEQIRDLSLEEAGRHLPVSLRGVVGWSHEQTPFAYIQDASGGIRVVNPKWENPGAMKPGTIVLLEGVTGAGDFVPVVTNAVLRRAGWWNMEDRHLVTLEQAMTGMEEGNWIELRGFVRELSLTNGLVGFNLSTPGGEFQAWTPASQSFASLKGAIIRVRGVCAAVANARHQLMGIQVWVPDVKYIQTEEPAPEDLFAVPLRPLAKLRRFNMESALNQRIRTSGTVILHVPGRYLYVQDGADSVLALSQQQEALRPGDRVEVVGFTGEEGRKVVLREAIYRRLGSGQEPQPVQWSAPRSVDVNSAGLLTQAEGILLNKAEKGDETRFLIQTKEFVFEASLGPVTAETGGNPSALESGSRLILTGVYEVQSDEYGQPRSFLLRLRSWNDVQLRQQAPWWTLARLLWALVGILIASLIGLIWGILITRKNALLRQAQAGLRAANNQLEIRVADRTSALEAANAQLKQEITKQLKLESQLRHSQKMEAVGQLAAGVAHDFNNILTVIKGNASLLQDQPLPDPASAGSLNDISVAAERAARLVRQLLAFSRKQVLRPEVLDLGQVVNHLEEMLKRLLGDHITLAVRTAPNLPPIRADLGMMEQIIMNLSVNARDAMPKGGRLTVGIDPVTVTSEEAQKDSEIRPGPHVRISVSDTGCGIAPELLPRVFDPFFTTKEVGKGTGLGLATVYGIVKQHHGWVEAQSIVNQGTTFRIFLPATRETSSPGNPPQSDIKVVNQGTECILVVEDEAHVRNLTVAVLRKNGYRVVEAASGKDAQAVFQNHGPEIDLLFTDVMMPGNLLGDELASRLRVAKPSLAVLFTSGYTPEANKTDGGGNGHFLIKPFTPAQMLTAVRQCLDGAAAEPDRSKT
jgi:two-component system, cell cycle sensor histidine kinase and response regulator CckA